ncbi:hypothetical protein GCM10010193_64180 [Kitasatospora atroaurantiaca]|uniref:Acyl carrier protein n=1 Tax=Kitasatospora atroaurantiaca TaxID=285545 RepID=A0A561F1N1_9ACTN|nr:acyl carrier protein [Kitasatospora atroaurantiaca]TWE21764.1 acyl carrier protein [Kitasatospora atroaurantiaca]
MPFDELKSILVSMGLLEGEITPEAIREEAGLDSLAVAELTLILRRDKGVPVSEEEIHGALTLAEVAEVVNSRTASAR